MLKKSKKLWLSLVLLSFVSLNYLAFWGWWISGVATLFIIYFSFLSWPTHYKKRLGIAIGSKQYFQTLIFLLITLPFSFALFFYITKENNINFQTGNIFNFIHVFFYTLNEEMIIGGLFLLFLKNKYQKLNSIYISIFVAVFFSLIHYFFYRWIFQEPARGILSITTILSLLMTGIIRNNLILKTGHIAFSWVLHLCWMSIMFGCIFYIPLTNEILTEAQRFNIFIGNEITLVTLSISALVITIWFFFHPKYVNK